MKPLSPNQKHDILVMSIIVTIVISASVGGNILKAWAGESPPVEVWNAISVIKKTTPDLQEIYKQKTELETKINDAYGIIASKCWSYDPKADKPVKKECPKA